MFALFCLFQKLVRYFDFDLYLPDPFHMLQIHECLLRKAIQLTRYFEVPMEFALLQQPFLVNQKLPWLRQWLIREEECDGLLELLSDPRHPLTKFLYERPMQ